MAISVATFVVLSAAVIYFLVLPTIADIKKMKAEIEAQRIDLENKYRKSKNLKKLTANLKKIEGEIEKLDWLFINQNRALEFITTLEEAAAKEGVSQKISLGTTAPLKNYSYKKIPLQIMADGNFISQLRYLANLEALNYYINIKTLEFSTAANDVAAKGGVNLQISSDTYWK